jgi:hypothetical protein
LGTNNQPVNNSHANPGDAGWRRFFIGVQVALVLSWFGIQGFNGKISDICFATAGITTVILLLVLPWFWASLRHVALVGWLMGVGSILLLASRSSGHR